MNPRPTSITVIAWALIVLGGIALITTSMMTNNPQAQEMMSKSPLPLSVQYAMSYAGILVSIVCGVAMLKGFNWGRTLYVAWSAVAFLIGFATSPMKAAMIPGLVVFLVIAFFLYRPKANAYFSPAVISTDAQGI